MLETSALFIRTYILYIRQFLCHDETRVCILLTSIKHLHDRIISLRGETWVHRTSLTLQLCQNAHKVPTKERAYVKKNVNYYDNKE